MQESTAARLSIRPGASLWFSPVEWLWMLGPLPPGVRIVGEFAGSTVAVVFVSNAGSIRWFLDRYRTVMALPPLVWVCYPTRGRSDFTRATRSLTLPQATSGTETILEAARGLLAAATPTIEAQGLTLVGISLANLQDERRMQLAFTFDPRFDALDAALDTVRDRFGSASVTRAVLLGRDPGVVMPVLPDEG